MNNDNASENLLVIDGVVLQNENGSVGGVRPMESTPQWSVMAAVCLGGRARDHQCAVDLARRD